MKDFDDLEKLKKELEYKASLPDADFELALKQKLLKLNDKTTFASKLTSIFENIRLNYSFASNLALVLVIIGIGTMLAFTFGSNITNPSTTTKNALFSSTANQEILSNVIKNNPMILLKDTTLANNFESVPVQDLSANTTMKSVTDNGLLYSIAMTSTLGEQATVCLQTAKQAVNIDLINYASNDGSNFYFRSIATDNNNNVLNYYLSDNSVQIIYSGGNNSYKYSRESLPSDQNTAEISNNGTLTPTSSSYAQDIIKNTLMIDSIVSIDNIKSTDNTPLIRITQKEENKMCDQNDNVGPIISVIDIDPISYKILSKSYYLGTESINNLIIKYNFKTSTSSLEEKLILQEFKYNLSYPLLDMTSQDSN